MARLHEQAQEIADRLGEGGSHDVSDQPRVPAGNGRESGQWTKDNSALGRMEQVTIIGHRPVRPTAFERAKAVYGETAGVRPNLIDPSGDRNDPNNWDSQSAGDLALARKFVAIVSGRNSNMREAMPDNFMDPNAVREWLGALEAGQASMESDGELDPRINRVFFEQKGSAQKVPQYQLIMDPIGPFQKRGKGDVPKGDQTYFHFFSDRK